MQKLDAECMLCSLHCLHYTSFCNSLSIPEGLSTQITCSMLNCTDLNSACTEIENTMTTSNYFIGNWNEHCNQLIYRYYFFELLGDHTNHPKAPAHTAPQKLVRVHSFCVSKTERQMPTAFMCRWTNQWNLRTYAHSFWIIYYLHVCTWRYRIIYMFEYILSCSDMSFRIIQVSTQTADTHKNNPIITKMYWLILIYTSQRLSRSTLSEALNFLLI